MVKASDLKVIMTESKVKPQREKGRRRDKKRRKINYRREKMQGKKQE